VQGASADRAIPRDRDDLADGKIVWADGAVVMQDLRPIKLNSCCFGIRGFCRLAFGTAFAAAGDRFAFACTCTARIHNSFPRLLLLIAGFGQLLLWAFCFLFGPMIKIILQSLTIFLNKLQNLCIFVKIYG
jgi:hypothetical protein